MKGSTISRRFREFVGVALFAAALIWLIALATYAANDPVWFFSTGLQATPANFAGKVGAFLAELSFQIVGYAAYVIPVLLATLPPMRRSVDISEVESFLRRALEDGA